MPGLDETIIKLSNNHNLLEFIYEQYKFYLVRRGNYVPLNAAKKLAVLNFLIDKDLNEN